MRRVTLLMLVVALTVALTAGVAAARTIEGTKGDDKLVGTNKADTLNGYAGNDSLYGRGGNDILKGYIGNDFPMRGGAGDDRIFGQVGADRAYGQAGNDFIKMVEDAQQDFVNCGEDADGMDLDRAEVSGNDLIDGTTAGGLTTTAGLSCEIIVVDGVPVPRF